MTARRRCAGCVPAAERPRTPAAAARLAAVQLTRPRNTPLARRCPGCVPAG
jgi:hypothetical protein